MTNQQIRFENAIKALRKDGVKIRQNVQKCCRGCIGYEDLNMKDETQPYAYTYGGQGFATSWSEGALYRRDKLRKSRNYYGMSIRPEESVMFNWGNGSAEKVAEAFRAEGFEVVWDGSEFSCVEVKLTSE